MVFDRATSATALVADGERRRRAPSERRAHRWVGLALSRLRRHSQLDAGLLLQIADDAEEVARLRIAARAEHVGGLARLVGAILLEQNDEWSVQRARYTTPETMATLSDDAIVGLPAMVV